MREILFRVWCEFEIDGQKHTSMEGPESWFLISQTGELWSYGPVTPPRPIGGKYTKTIVMMNIGLKDKGGKEIYGGDILKANNRPEPYVVDWIDSMAAWFPFCKEEIIMNGFEVEIIGNIHENPELLK